MNTNMKNTGKQTYAHVWKRMKKYGTSLNQYEQIWKTYETVLAKHKTSMESYETVLKMKNYNYENNLNILII